MIHIHHTNYNPIVCALAIAGASIIYVDLETTGLHDYDCIVAAGVLVGHNAHIIVTNQHKDISSLPYQVDLEGLRLALSPLAVRRDLIAVFQNAVFDVAMLERLGIRVNCIIHDTWKCTSSETAIVGRKWTKRPTSAPTGRDWNGGSTNPCHTSSKPLLGICSALRRSSFRAA